MFVNGDGNGAYAVALAALNVFQTVVVAWLANRAVKKDRNGAASKCDKCEELRRGFGMRLKTLHNYHDRKGR